MAKYTIDPITRIEGHLRIDVEIEGGKVKDAWSSAQLFRGLEIILQGRDPRDAPYITQRACGVCTEVHALASIRALDDAAGAYAPDLGRLARNLVHGAQYLHDHITHFYALSALDWVDVVSALSADPKKTASWPTAWATTPTAARRTSRRSRIVSRPSCPAASWARSPTATGDTRTTACPRGQPAGRIPLPDVAAPASQGLAHDGPVRRQKPAYPDLRHRRRELRAGYAQRRPPGRVSLLPQRDHRLCRQRLHPRRAGRGLVLQGLGRQADRRLHQLPGLRQLPAKGRQVRHRGYVAARRRDHEPRHRQAHGG